MAVVGTRLLAGVCGILGLGLTFLFWSWQTCAFGGCPDVGQLRGYLPGEASLVLDRRGSVLARLYRVPQPVVPLDSLPPYVPAAFVAIEDKRFYRHHGVDWLRVPGALARDVAEGDFAQGFSTITMQLARNLFPDRLPAAEKSPARKLAEMRVATEIEDRYSKREILQMYLNQIYFGRGAWGVQQAAEEYFAKPARELTLAEAATLAGVPKAPSRSNPRADEAAAQARRNLVLRRMAEQGMVPAAAARAAMALPSGLRKGELTGTLQVAPYFLQAVRHLLERQLGEAVYTQGLRIWTTLDLPTQVVAEAELERQLEAIEGGAYGRYTHPPYAADAPDATAYLQCALLMLDSRTGDVLAWIGGRDFAQSRFDRVTDAHRQPGSTFKVFVAAAAVAAGYPPTHRLPDRPLAIRMGGGTWSPRNEDGQYKGSVSMAQALVESRNPPTVALARQIGPARVARLAHQMGIEDSIPLVPSMPLGVGIVTPWELIDAYTAFSSLGDRAVPRLVTRVEGRDGKVVWGQPRQIQRTLDPAVAFVVTSMLRQAVDQGTGAPARAAGFRGPAAGKTGTTQSVVDAWFVGFTPRLTMGIWLGFDRPTSIVAASAGGELAATAWGRIMARVAAPTPDWTPPPGVERMWLAAGGAVLPPNCRPPPGAEPVWFVSAAAPRGRDCPSAGSHETGTGVRAVADDPRRADGVRGARVENRAQDRVAEDPPVRESPRRGGRGEAGVTPTGEVRGRHLPLRPVRAGRGCAAGRAVRPDGTCAPGAQ